MNALKIAYKYVLMILNPFITWWVLFHFLMGWQIHTGRLEGATVRAAIVLAFIYLFIFWGLHKLNKKLNNVRYLFFDDSNSFVAFVYVIGYLATFTLFYGALFPYE